MSPATRAWAVELPLCQVASLSRKPFREPRSRELQSVATKPLLIWKAPTPLGTQTSLPAKHLYWSCEPRGRLADDRLRRSAADDEPETRDPHAAANSNSSTLERLVAPHVYFPPYPGSAHSHCSWRTNQKGRCAVASRRNSAERLA